MEAVDKPLVVGWDLSHPPQKRSTVVDAAFSRIFPLLQLPSMLLMQPSPLVRTLSSSTHTHTLANASLYDYIHTHRALSPPSPSPATTKATTPKPPPSREGGLLSAPRLLLLLLPEDFQTDNSRQQTHTRGKGQRESEEEHILTIQMRPRGCDCASARRFKV